MVNWDLRTLESISLKITDGSHSSPVGVESGYPMASVKDLTPHGINVSSCRHISQEDYDLLVKNGCKPERNDVLIAKDGNSCLDTVCLYQDDLEIVLLSSVAIIKPDPTQVVPRYLSIYLSDSGVRSQMKELLISGSAIPRVVLKAFRQYQIKLPPIHVQEQIANIIGSLDDKIELNRQMNETLEQMAMALYKHWFVEEAHDEATFVRFADYVQINPSLTVKKRVEVKFIEMKVLPTDSMSILDDDVAVKPFTSGSKFQNGDTLLARITPCLENGKTAFVDFLETGEIASGSTEFLVLRAKENCNPYFVYCLSRSDTFRDYAMKSMVGTSGRQRVQTISIQEYLLPQPDTKLMLEFAEKAKKWFGQIRSNTKEITTLKQLRNYLLPRLLSGELNLQAAKEQIEEVLSHGDRSI